MKDIDRIFNPDERFLKYQDYLIDLIASSYHKKFKDIIATRIKNVFCYFDSTPDITYQAVKRFNPNIKNLLKYFFLNNDYKLVRCELNSIKKQRYCRYLKEFLSISDRFFKGNRNIILNLNFVLFSKEINNILADTSLNPTIKEIINRNRQRYLDTCHSIGLEPITDEDKVEDYLCYKERFDKIVNRVILESSFFGRGVIRKLRNENTSFESELDSIASNLVFLDKKNSAITTRIKTKQNKYRTMISMPVLANTLCEENLDSTLIHELIHVSEIDTDSKYQKLLFSKKYNLFSEVRTAKKEKELFEKLRRDNIYIFDQDNSFKETISSYWPFVPLINSILDNYRELFDYCSITNKLAPIYNNLGRENFDDFCESIEILHDKLILMLICDISTECLDSIITNREVYDEYMDRFKTYRKTK